MNSSLFVILAIVLLLVVGTTAEGRVRHGYSAVFSLDTVTAVSDQDHAPQANHIATIYPNPFNPRTTIAFELAEIGAIELAIFDLRGRLVRVVASGSWPSGRHQTTWDGQDDGGQAVPTGTYCCRLCTPHGSQTKRMTLVR